MKKKLAVFATIIIFIIGITITINASEFDNSGTLYSGKSNPVYSNENINYSTKYRMVRSAPTKNSASLEDYKEDKNIVASEVRDYMVDRTESFVVYGKMTLEDEITQDIFDEYTSSIIEKAISEELANSSSAGDYLRWSWGNYKVLANYAYIISEDSYIYYFNLGFNFKYYTSNSQEEKLNNDIKSYISENIETTDSEYEKICAIYDFIASNVRYDYDNLEDSTYLLKYTAYAALENKTAVCQGYATLFYKMAKECGIKDVRVMTSETHAWNIIKLNDKYYNLDSTWDEGNTIYYYFLKGSDNFKEADHIRSSEYCTEEFEMEYPTSTTDYDNTKEYISFNKCIINDISDYTYDGNAKVPQVTVKYNSNILSDEVNYKISYMNNVNAGTATIKLVGLDNYVGTQVVKFKINPANIMNGDYNISIDTSNKKYTGKAIKTNVSIKNLKYGTDYTVTYQNNVNVGKATVKITGIGNYTGNTTKTFNIYPSKITKFTASKSETTKIKLSWDKQPGVTSYKLYKYNSKKKKYDCIKTLNSNTTTYWVNKLSSGTSYTFRIRAEKQIDGKTVYGDYNKINVATAPKSVTITSVKSGSKKLTVKWKKISACSGYEIQYSTSNKFTSSTTKKVTVNGKSNINKTIKNLKKNKKYYVRIRAYKTVDGKKYYSSYSKVKNIKVK